MAKKNDTIPRIAQGQPITAEWLNRLVDSVNASGAMVAGGSGAANAAMQALMALEPEAVVIVLVKEVLVPEIHSGDPAEAGMLGVMTVGGPAYWPSTVKYRYVGLRREGVKSAEAGELPAEGFGRPVKGDAARIHPVPVNTLGVVLRFSDAEGVKRSVFGFAWVTELVARRVCGV